MKQVIVLCDGPGLSSYVQPDADGPMVIAVDRAAVLQAADVWVCLDPGSSSATGVRGWIGDFKGTPQLLTSTPKRLDNATRLNVIDDPTFWNLFDRTRIGWTNASVTTAVAYAAHLGATEIDVYGLETVEDGQADNRKTAVEILNTLTTHLHECEGIAVRIHAIAPASQANEADASPTPSATPTVPVKRTKNRNA